MDYEKLSDKTIKIVFDRFNAINTEWLELQAEHFAKINNEFSKLDKWQQYEIMKKNAEKVKIDIDKAVNESILDIQEIYRELGEMRYSDARKLYIYQGIKQIPFAQNIALQRIIKAQAKITKNKLINLANTTVKSLSYRDAIDIAVTKATLGTESYNNAIRSVIKQQAKIGLSYYTPKVEYESGIRIRLDSSVRMNVLEGIRTTNISIAEQIGDEYGADGVEITAHGLCAEDHIEINGKTYSKKEWERTNGRLERKVGTLNCKHFAIPILLNISKPSNTKQQIEEMNKRSMEKIQPFKERDKKYTKYLEKNNVKLSGEPLKDYALLKEKGLKQPPPYYNIEKSRYKWTQEQRKIETQIRYQKDIANMAKVSGNDSLRREAQANINKLTKKYDDMSKATGLIEKKERMQVSGFRAVKIK